MVYLKLLKSTKARLLIIIFLTFLAYSNIFQNQFVGDDINLIVNWDFIHHLENLPELALNNVFPEGYDRYRPVSSAILMLNYKIWGPNPFGYHLHSILVHLLATVLVYFIVKKIAYPFTFTPLPFITALLFGLHPIHTEAITFMMASIDSTGFLFYFAAFYFYVTHKKITSVIFTTLAVFTNELASTLPLVLLFYDLIFKKAKFRLNLNFIRQYLPYFIPLLVYLFIRVGYLKIPGGDFAYFGGSFYLTMLTMVKALIRYMQLFAIPLNLSPYPHVAPGIESYVGKYAPQAEILSQSIFDLDILIYLGLLGLLGLLGVRTRKKYPLISFSIFWFFITFIPALNIIPVGNVMQERYAYLPSFGFVLLLAYGLFWISDKAVNIIQKSCLAGRQAKGKRQKFGSLALLNENVSVTKTTILLTFAFLLLTFYGYQTYQRNKDWKDPKTFWSKAVLQVPDYFWANLFLANSLANEGEYEMALKYYQKALEIEPDDQGIKSNIDKVNKLKNNSPGQ